MMTISPMRTIVDLANIPETSGMANNPNEFTAVINQTKIS